MRITLTERDARLIGRTLARHRHWLAGVALHSRLSDVQKARYAAEARDCQRIEAQIMEAISGQRD